VLIEILISIALGTICGAITGILPGIHINLVGTILVALTATILSGINPIFLIVFIASMTIAHTFIDFIPSIFLGCPDTETQLSILPGHQMLKEGRGYEAVMLTAYGGISAVVLLLIISFPLAFLVSKIYDSLHSIMAWILIGATLILIFTEKKKLTAIFVFLLSGILGLCVLNLQLNEPLLPLLTGLFGSSMIITSIKNKIQIPKQEITKPKVSLFRPLIGAVIASPLCGFLPGLGGGQSAILANTISRTESKGFLVLVGATNILVMGLSFVSLYAISKTRTGAAVAIQEIIGVLSWKLLLLLLFCVLISGIVSFFLTKFLTKRFSKIINRINYSALSIGTLIFLTGIVLIISGFLGLLVLIASTFTGIYFNSLEVKKTHMMGCLLVPTILYYLGIAI
jgi:putative membrane protein